MRGIDFGEYSIVVDNMPYRKKKCLCVMKDNTIIKYATFNNDESAEEFMDILMQCLHISEDDLK